MHTKLEEIISKTRQDVNNRKQVSSDNGFYHAIQSPKHGSIAIIAEIKFASPTEPDLGSHDQLLSQVLEYEKAGSDAISIVTEKHFFKGDPKFVSEIKQAIILPVLQKDFILDKYQIYETAKNGADAILLIAKLLSKNQLIRFVEIAKDLHLDPVVEINSEEDLQKAQTSGTKIIAVNARDLDTFKVDVDKACQLLKKIPKKFIKLGFSGVKGKVEMEKYKNAGANGVLIGTSLMKADNIAQFIEGIRT